MVSESSQEILDLLGGNILSKDLKTRFDVFEGKLDIRNPIENACLRPVKQAPVCICKAEFVGLVGSTSVTKKFLKFYVAKP